jgi:hypothetical protein
VSDPVRGINTVNNELIIINLVSVTGGRK